jgi:hypothetical protein
MGYDVHITRRDDWPDDGPEISLHEWLGLVAGDPDLRHDGFAESTTADGDVVRVDAKGIAVWTAHSGHEPGGSMAWFLHDRGEVVVKNPDEEILAKMVDVAGRLGARVQGDDGEYYDGEAAPPSPTSPVGAPAPSGPPQRRRWWKRSGR